MRPGQDELLRARERVTPLVHETPVLTSRTLDGMTDAHVFFKCENFQRTGSFKLRGAGNAVAALIERGPVTAVASHSSGNYAQALAWAAATHGLKCYVVMPETAAEVKKRAVAGYGAEIIPCAPTLEARESTLKEVVARTGAAFLHPFDDYDVIAGQSTACQELLASTPDLDFVIAPVGGGGLVSGTALAAHYFSPRTRVVAGEPFGADDAYHSFQAGEIIPCSQPRTLADGLLTTLGQRTFPIIQDHVERIIRVDEEEIVAAMRLIWERLKIIIEPSAAVAVAALLREKAAFRSCRVGVILSGGNVDLARLPF
jgi:threonine dehydratase